MTVSFYSSLLVGSADNTFIATFAIRNNCLSSCWRLLDFMGLKLQLVTAFGPLNFGRVADTCNLLENSMYCLYSQ